ncbi:unnamed protein product [Timema podura]|uniref:C2H2-type domain-containing protein n=1 Tax=Timema podura TaxID=61482 RepID=A0ABN7NN47_TIMPD|nr:unnamed protein product [Timema podura]
MIIHSRTHSGENQVSSEGGISTCLTSGTEIATHFCTMCGVMFKSDSKLCSHIQTHLEERLPVCEAYEKIFSSADNLKSRMEDYCKGEQVFVCELCENTFTSNKNLSSHMKIHLAERDPCTCDSCGKTFVNRKKLLGHMKSHKNHKCPTCGRDFNLIKRLRIHMKSHSEERPYSCDVCYKKFKRSYYLIDHRKIHTGEKLHECDVCGYTCIQKVHLVNHKKRHFNQYKFDCDLCGKGFHTNTELQGHKNVHLGERPYMCDICGKAYPSKTNMMGHKRAQHPETAQNPKKYECDICRIFLFLRQLWKKGYYFNIQLSSHKNKHPLEIFFDWEVCKKGLPSIVVLWTHKKNHMEDKSNKILFICEVCRKHFMLKSWLNLHLQLRKGEHNYLCDLCGKKFYENFTMLAQRFTLERNQNSAVRGSSG